jgi:hypothetical protein
VAGITLLLVRIDGAVAGDNPMESRFHGPAKEHEENGPAPGRPDGDGAAGCGRLPLGESSL